MRPEKEYIEQEYSRLLETAAALVLTDYQGLSAEAFNSLREEVTDLDARCVVVKNRIFKRVIGEGNRAELSSHCEGQTAVLMTSGELPALLKVVTKFMEEEGSPRFKAGMWGEDVFNEEELKQLAELPSRDELLAKVFGAIQAPLSGMVGVCNGLLSGLVGALNQIKEKKAE